MNLIRYVLLFAALALSAASQARDFSKVVIKPLQVSGNVYMLKGAGVSIGVSIGDDGVLMIDDQFAPLSEKIISAIKSLTDQSIKFVINTHWHGDHTGGNESMGKAGAIIVAHENVRERMSTKQFMKVFGRETPASPDVALPVITFSDEMTFHWNGEAIDVIHIDPAHTDGDSIIYFKQANVIHMGDAYFAGRFPFIDTSSGGSITGVIAAAEKVLAMSNDSTKIIPGHGALSNPQELQVYQDMLVDMKARIVALIEAGKSRSETVAAKPSRQYDAEWGKGFMKPDVWVGIVYDSLMK